MRYTLAYIGIFMAGLAVGAASIHVERVHAGADVALDGRLQNVEFDRHRYIVSDTGFFLHSPQCTNALCVYEKRHK